ncbi:MAG: glycosyltransferase [Nitrospirae bacterium]|nr:glycosyltransferase [Nitrospirota bacterium]
MFTKPSLCIIGKTIYIENRLNHKTIAAMASYFDVIYLIVKSAQRSIRIIRDTNAVVIALPSYKNKLFDYMSFVIIAVPTVIALSIWHKKIILDVSEPIGGGIAAVILKLLAGKDYMFHIQGQLLELPKKDLSGIKVAAIHYIVKVAAVYASAVRCVSHSIFNSAVDAGISKDKLHYLPARCDTEQFNPDKVWPSQALKLQWNIQDKRVLLFVGSFTVHKGVSYLIDAFSLVAQTHKDIVLLLVGSGVLEEKMKTMVSTLNIEDKVIFCGRVPYEDVALYLSIADVFVFASIDEGLPRAILEAMSMKVPVVATGVGGIPEIVEHMKTGFLVEAGNSKMLSEGIATLLDSGNLSVMGDTARKTIIEKYNFQREIQNYVEVLYSIADLPGHSEFQAR